MTFTNEQIQNFFIRVEKLNLDSTPKFGKMNVNQMVCHCSDFFRLALGTKKEFEYGVVDPKEIIELPLSGKTAPAPKGFGQVEGNGTLPTDLENDKRILKAYIVQFAQKDKDYEFAEHPYFGYLSHERWAELANYHLDHHLKQFGV